MPISPTPPSGAKVSSSAISSPHRGRGAEIDVTRGNRDLLAGIGADDHAALLVNRVESPQNRIPAGPDRNGLPETCRPRKPKLPDFAKTPAIVPDAAELRPAIGE